MRSDYEGALKNFMESYKYSKFPELLFNIARCHESLAHYKEAIQFFTRFQKARKQKDPKIDSRIANLKKLQARKDASETKRQAEIERLRKLDEQRKADEARRKKEEEDRRKNAKSIHSGSWPGWVVAGGGVALIGAGIIFGALAAGKASDLENAAKTTPPAEYENVKSDESAGKAFQAVQIVTLVAGSAAVVTGGVLLFLHYRKAGSEQPKSTAWFAPAPLPGGAMVNAGLRF
ncbi:MAG: hypothetical protein KC503_31095 [Myxococcales bacterium]|nr:hypothetical protein [Myxococcales bacterium]